ncbi:protein lethal(2)essential for life-like protein, partial [Leptotrombidium deliense]
LFKQLLKRTNAALDTVGANYDFRIHFDVSHFTPDELNVKIYENNELVVEGEHDEREDEFGFVSRTFTRRYVAPSDVDIDKLRSIMLPEGIMVLTAPRKHVIHTTNDAHIPTEALAFVKNNRVVENDQYSQSSGNQIQRFTRNVAEADGTNLKYAKVIL